MRILQIVFLMLISTGTHAADFSVGLGSEFPIGAHLEGNITINNFYTRVRYAQFLEPYTNSMNSIAESADFYNEATGDIIAEALSGGNYIELGFGYALEPKSGWRFDLAYAMAKGQGQVTGSTIAQAVADITLPNGTNLYDIEGQVDNFALRATYRYNLKENQSIDFAFGVIKPIDSETTIDRNTTGPVQEAILQAANRNLDEYLNDTLKNDVYIPVLTATWVVSF
jgi:hypothetical protein